MLRSISSEMELFSSSRGKGYEIGAIERCVDKNISFFCLDVLLLI